MLNAISFQDDSVEKFFLGEPSQAKLIVERHDSIQSELCISLYCRSRVIKMLTAANICEKI